MLDTIFQGIGYLAIRFLNLFINNNILLNNDIESCCLINDDTTTYSE
jgi:hypothetical protein